jgi:hypothetical protein
MAHEIVQSKPPTKRSDIYALGRVDFLGANKWGEEGRPK